MFAGLSKKGIPRGQWRFLYENEIGYLNMISNKVEDGAAVESNNDSED